MQQDRQKIAKGLDKFLEEVEWFSTLGLTSRGLRLLLNIYLEEGKRVSFYNAKVNSNRPEAELKSTVGKTSGYLTNFERLSLIVKVQDDTDVRGQAKCIFLTNKVKSVFDRLLPVICEQLEEE